MPLILNVSETRYVPVLVTGINLATSLIVNPTTSSVSMGFVSSLDGGQVAPGTFFPAVWVSNIPANLYYAVLLVGPAGGATTLAPGSWRPWVNFAFGGETIIQGAIDTLTMQA